MWISTIGRGTRRPGVTQDRFGFPWGNCLEACIATILGVPIEAVPDPRDDACGPVVCDDDARAAQLIHPRVPVLNAWLVQNHGLTLLEGTGAHPPLQAWPRPKALFWIAAGTSPRDPKLFHAVVYANDTITWDPHPSHAGLAGPPQRWTVLAPLGCPL